RINAARSVDAGDFLIGAAQVDDSPDINPARVAVDRSLGRAMRTDHRLTLRSEGPELRAGIGRAAAIGRNLIGGVAVGNHLRAAKIQRATASKRCNSRERPIAALDDADPVSRAVSGGIRSVAAVVF